ncbi:MAG: hypothetical protein GXZ15_04515 [Campylobacter sp.]|nr:hypothetical protein [Campylobacter sp.]
MFKKCLLATIFLVVGLSAFDVSDIQTYEKIIKLKVENLEENATITYGKETNQKLITCVPALKGRTFIAKNGKNINFISNELFESSTNYLCKIGKNEFSFKTDEFKAFALEALDDFNDKYMLEFNDKVDYNALRKAIKFKSSDENLEYEILKQSDYRYIIVINNKNEFTASLDGSFKSKNGKALSKEYIFSSKEAINARADRSSALNVVGEILPIAKSGDKLGFRIGFDNYFCVQNFDFIDVDVVSQRCTSYDEGYYLEFYTDDFKPNEIYDITFKKGFGGSGYYLKEDVKFSLKTSDYASFVEFKDQLPYISSVGKIAINSTNVKSIDVSLSKVEEENFRYFINFNSDIFKSATPVTNHKFDINYVPNERVFSTFSLDFDGKKDGIYLLEISYKDSLNKTVKVQKPVYFSDLAISAKISDEGAFVFVNRLEKSEILKGADITIYSDKNQILASGVSDKNGIFTYKEKDFLSKNPKSVVAKFKDERNFLIFDDMFKANSFGDKNAFIYFTSSIIRPGSELTGVIILKDDFKPIAQLPLRVEILDWLGKIVYKNSFKTDEFGSVKFDENLSFDLTGSYEFRAIYEDEILNSQTFHVESFIPQRIKTGIKFSSQSYFLGENIELKLFANYLFGAKGAGLEGSGKVIISQSEFLPDKFSEYSFTNELLTPYQTLYSDEFSITLDENAEATLNFVPEILGNISSIATINANFSINDGGQIVSKRDQAVLYPYKSMVGISSDKSYIGDDEKINFSFVSIDPVALKELSSKLSATLYKVSYYSFFNYQGYYGYWDYKKSYSKVKNYDINGDTLELANLPNGEYMLVVEDTNSTHKASKKFFVSGYDSYLTPTVQSQKVDIKLNQNSYQKGDILKASINSSIKDALMLVTLEDEGVLDYKIVQVSHYNGVVNFDIKQDMKAGYLSVKILKIADKAPFKAEDKVYLKRNLSKYTQNLELNTPAKSSSGKSVEVLVKSEPNSKIYLFAVDEGILQIADQSSPDPLSFFDKDYYSLISDFDIYDNLTGYENLGDTLSFGSGEMMMKSALDKYKDPLKTKKQETFFKIYDDITDKSGEAKFEIEIPKYLNSEIRLDAISLNGEKISSKSSSFKVEDEFMIIPPELIYLQVGDSVELPIRVFNNSDKEINLDTNITCSANLNLLDIDTKSPLIKPNSSYTFDLKILANESGKASIRFQSSKFDKELEFEIISPYSLKTNSLNGVTSDKEKFKFPNSTKSVKISLFNSPFAFLIKSSDEIIRYPYGSLEGSVSKLLAMMYLNPSKESKKLEKEGFIRSGIRDILSKQRSSGEFKYSTQNSHAFSSIYATDVLFELKDLGYDVFDESLDLAVKYLENEKFTLNFNKIYALYLLSKLGIANSSVINYMYDNKLYKDDIVTMYFMAAVLKNSNLLKESKEVYEQIKVSENLGKYDFENFSSPRRNLAFALYLHAENFPRDEFSQALYEKVVENFPLLNSTQERAFSMRAINFYTKNNEDIKFRLKNTTEIYELNSNSYLELDLLSDELELSALAGDVFYSIIYYSYEEDKLKHLISSGKDLSIYREFVDINDEPVDLENLELNSMIFTKNTIRTTKNFESILVYEQIPSCFEHVNESVEKILNRPADSAKLSHQEVKDSSVISFLKPVYGEVVFYTPYYASIKGKCALSAVRVESMQDESINDYDLEIRTIRVK